MCHGPRLEHEQQLILYMVFEHVDQDLACYLERCPAPGLSADRIKVINRLIITRANNIKRFFLSLCST